MDDFDEIISKMRRGELILWVGSGFSNLAGYPTGSQLTKTIKDKLNPDEKQYFDNKFNFDEVAEEFVQLRSRKELEFIIHEVFKQVPTDLTHHKMISEIPQLQIIITTNYDKSFEYTYKNDIFPIIRDKDFPTITRNKISLYKIHGDIELPDSMIITKSDYRDYYDSGKEDLIWNEIKSLVSKYSILFIGYSAVCLIFCKIYSIPLISFFDYCSITIYLFPVIHSSFISMSIETASLNTDS